MNSTPSHEVQPYSVYTTIAMFSSGGQGVHYQQQPWLWMNEHASHPNTPVGYPPPQEDILLNVDDDIHDQLKVDSGQGLTPWVFV